MHHNWLRTHKYYVIAAFGLAIITFGQFMARPQFYGTAFGRAWAHVSLMGFLLLAGSLIHWTARSISNHKNAPVVAAGKRQIIGMISISGVIGFLTAIAVLFGDTALTWNDGEARRGVFVLWLMLIVALTVCNIGWLIMQQFKQSKRA